MTINEIYEEWVINKAHYVKQSSMSSYNMVYRKNVKDYFGDKNPEEITNNVMNAFLLHLVEKGLSNKTAGDTCIVVKMLIDFYYEKNDLPAVRFKLKYPTNNNSVHQLEVYSEAEQKKILNFLIENHSPAYLAIAITLCTGMRIGEICALRWGDIDIDNKLIHIKQTVQRIYVPEETNLNKAGKTRATKIIFDSPKTKSSYRSVPIASVLIKLLKDYKRIMQDDYFVNTGTRKLNEPRTFRSQYNNIITNEIKLGRCIHFHGLRHSFASRLIATGTDVKTTSKILGHSKVEMTMNLYVHPTDLNKQDAVNKSMRNLFK